ncbi:MAG TPA: SWIM zinc finger family protein [Streptosporangiaceae bacterium]|nr:SWIM zinc finger family protein [Streptosporangiaceae bacterium]
MAERWDQARVLTLAPDASSQRSARSLVNAGSWITTGSADPAALWGECRGSAAAPYRTAVDLSGRPAYKCSCPSRKLPCKHALGLLLLWSAGGVQPGTPPDWVRTWLTARAARAQDGKPAEPADPEAARRRAQQREQRVASGMDELDRWLCDQVRQGLAATPRAGYQHWDSIAARMVDAQASGLAERLRSFAAVPHSGAGWESRLLEEYAMLHLLATAFRRQSGPLEVVRSRIGFTVRQDSVLADGERVLDRWQVLARRDTEQERLRTRRVWLRSPRRGRYALVLSFAFPGESFDGTLIPGTEADLELAFYPGTPPLRALVVSNENRARAKPPDGGTVADLLTDWARALSQDPWLDSWPAVLNAVTPLRAPQPAVCDPSGAALPLHPAAADNWPLFALSAGRPLTLAGEWTPRGLVPLTAWDETGRPVVL